MAATNNENAIEFLAGQEVATVTFSQAKYANKIRALAEKYPDEVQIIADGPENCGYLYAHIPTSWIRIKPLSKAEIEQRRKASANMAGPRDEKGRILKQE